MSIGAALQDRTFLCYAALGAVLLLSAGSVLLAIRHLLHKNIDSMWKTYMAWVFMIPLVILVVFLGREATILGVALLSLGGLKEFARATGLYEDWGQIGVIYAGTCAVALTSLVPDPNLGVPGWYGLFIVLPVYVVSAVLAVPILRDVTRGQLQRTSLSILGFVYLGWMLGHAGFLANSPHAYGYVLFLVFAVETNDIAAFTFGKLFGHRKLRPNISPNKTLGGSLGALGVSMALPWLLWFSFPHFGPLQLVLTGLIVGIGAQLGDLSISFIKRDIGVKDMGGLIPGHGGVLDRVDSLIFTAPLFFHMTRWFYGTA